MDRRDFLARAGAFAAVGSMACGAEAGDAMPAASTAAAQTTLSPPLERVGVQLYTLRSLVADDMPGTLDAVARIGYDEVELRGDFQSDAARLKSWLDASGLDAPSAHADEAAMDAGLDRTLEAAGVLGLRWVVLPSIAQDQRTADGYARTAAMLNRAGERASAQGIRAAYHNHAFEFEPVGDTNGMQILLDELDPAYVDIELDFHWAAVGGAEPAELFAAHPGRFTLCHVKDITADGVMADVGAGVLPWGDYFAMSEQAGLVHYLVEHDQPGDPLASVTASYRYLTGQSGP